MSNEITPVQYSEPEIDFELTAIKKKVDEALDALPNEMQRKFVELYAGNDTANSATRCAITAGYSKNSARSQVSELLTKPNVQRALKVLRTQYAYVNGIGTAWKRQQLVNIITKAQQGEKPQHMAATKAVELLSKIDGELEIQKHGAAGSSGGVTIQIITGVPERPAVTVAGEVINPILEQAEKHNKEHNDG